LKGREMVRSLGEGDVKCPTKKNKQGKGKGKEVRRGSCKRKILNQR